jgi:hypothetical protein
MLVIAPIGESGKIFEDALGIRMKDVRTIWVYEHAMAVQGVICVSSDMCSLL